MPKDILAEWQREVRKIPSQVGTIAVNFFKDNIEKQGFQGDNGLEKWPERQADAARNDRPLLVDTGELKASIKKQVSGSQVKVRVTGGAEKYADIHNTGGVTHPKVTAKSKAFFWAMYKATGQKRFKAMALSTQLTVKIPKRQYIGDSKKLNERIAKMNEKKLQKIFNG